MTATTKTPTQTAKVSPATAEALKNAFVKKVIAHLPKKLDGVIAQEAICALIRLCNGERLHKNAGWHHSGGWNTFQTYRDVETAETCCTRGGVNLIRGNDAPRGGRTGDYFQLARKNPRAAAALSLLVKEGK